MYNNQRVGVVIPAAGQSVRMGGKVKKQFVELFGKPVWVHTVERFHSCPEVDVIVLAVPPEFIQPGLETVHAMRLQKVRAVVEGGTHRQDSVHFALQALKPFSPDVILVHDAVRPFVTPQLIVEVLDGACTYGAAVPAVKPKETVKISNGDSFVQLTPDRDKLWVVQTPQGFRASLLYDAFDRAVKDHFYATDEASIVERMGARVKILPGRSENIKITLPEDLYFAELLMQNTAS